MTVEALTEPQAMDALADLAAQVPADQVILEVGVYHAVNLVNMALGARKGNRAKVFGCDPYGSGDIYRGRPHMLQRYTDADLTVARQYIKTNRCSRAAKILVGTSTDTATTWDRGPIGLLVIDAEHTYRSVKADLAAWAPHLAPDALIAFDDYGGRVGADIKRFVDEQLADGTLTLHSLAGSRMAICTQSST